MIKNILITGNLGYIGSVLVPRLTKKFNVIGLDVGYFKNCILVKDNRIIAHGYNGFLPGCPHKSIIRDNHEQSTVHAEQNTIADCAKRTVSCYDACAYITHYPCITCAKILLASGIKEIFYINDYKNDNLVEEFANQCNVAIIKI